MNHISSSTFAVATTSQTTTHKRNTPTKAVLTKQKTQQEKLEEIPNTVNLSKGTKELSLLQFSLQTAGNDIARSNSSIIQNNQNRVDILNNGLKTSMANPSISNNTTIGMEAYVDAENDDYQDHLQPLSQTTNNEIPAGSKGQLPAHDLICGACGFEEEYVEGGLIPCKKCKQVYYCSNECRAWDWSTGNHAKECQDNIPNSSIKSQTIFKAGTTNRRAVEPTRYSHDDNSSISSMDVSMVVDILNHESLGQLMKQPANVRVRSYASSIAPTDSVSKPSTDTFPVPIKYTYEACNEDDEKSITCKSCGLEAIFIEEGMIPSPVCREHHYCSKECLDWDLKRGDHSHNYNMEQNNESFILNLSPQKCQSEVETHGENERSVQSMGIDVVFDKIEGNQFCTVDQRKRVSPDGENRKDQHRKSKKTSIYKESRTESLITPKASNIPAKIPSTDKINHEIKEATTKHKASVKKSIDEQGTCKACGFEAAFVEEGMIPCGYCDEVVYCSRVCLEWDAERGDHSTKCVGRHLRKNSIKNTLQHKNECTSSETQCKREDSVKSLSLSENFDNNSATTDSESGTDVARSNNKAIPGKGVNLLEKKTKSATPTDDVVCKACGFEAAFVEEGMIPCGYCDEVEYCSQVCLEWDAERGDHSTKCVGRHLRTHPVRSTIQQKNECTSSDTQRSNEDSVKSLSLSENFDTNSTTTDSESRSHSTQQKNKVVKVKGVNLSEKETKSFKPTYDVVCEACGFEAAFVEEGMIPCGYCDEVVYCSRVCLEWDAERGDHSTKCVGGHLRTHPVRNTMQHKNECTSSGTQCNNEDSVKSLSLSENFDTNSMTTDSESRSHSTEPKNKTILAKDVNLSTKKRESSPPTDDTVCKACGFEAAFVEEGMIPCGYCDEVVYCSQVCLEWDAERGEHSTKCVGRHLRKNSIRNTIQNKNECTRIGTQCKREDSVKSLSLSENFDSNSTISDSESRSHSTQPNNKAILAKDVNLSTKKRESSPPTDDTVCKACGFEAAFVEEGMIPCGYCDEVMYCSRVCLEWDAERGDHSTKCVGRHLRKNSMKNTMQDKNACTSSETQRSNEDSVKSLSLSENFDNNSATADSESRSDSTELQNKVVPVKGANLLEKKTKSSKPTDDVVCKACGFEAAFVEEGMIPCGYCDEVVYCSRVCLEWDAERGDHSTKCVGRHLRKHTVRNTMQHKNKCTSSETQCKREDSVKSLSLSDNFDSNSTTTDSESRSHSTEPKNMNTLAKDVNISTKKRESSKPTDDVVCKACGFEAAFVEEGMIPCGYCDEVVYCSRVCLEWDAERGDHSTKCVGRHLRKNSIRNTMQHKNECTSSETQCKREDSVKSLSLSENFDTNSMMTDSESHAVAARSKNKAIPVKDANLSKKKTKSSTPTDDVVCKACGFEAAFVEEGMTPCGYCDEVVYCSQVCLEWDAERGGHGKNCAGGQIQIKLRCEEVALETRRKLDLSRNESSESCCSFNLLDNETDSELEIAIADQKVLVPGTRKALGTIKAVPKDEFVECKACGFELRFVEEGSLSCLQCETVLYCSVECRAWDWKSGAHEKNCKRNVALSGLNAIGDSLNLKAVVSHEGQILPEGSDHMLTKTFSKPIYTCAKVLPSTMKADKKGIDVLSHPKAPSKSFDSAKNDYPKPIWLSSSEEQDNSFSMDDLLDEDASQLKSIKEEENSECSGDPVAEGSWRSRSPFLTGEELGITATICIIENESEVKGASPRQILQQSQITLPTSNVSRSQTKDPKKSFGSLQSHFDKAKDQENELDYILSFRNISSIDDRLVGSKSGTLGTLEYSDSVAEESTGDVPIQNDKVDINVENNARSVPVKKFTESELSNFRDKTLKLEGKRPNPMNIGNDSVFTSHVTKESKVESMNNLPSKSTADESKQQKELNGTSLSENLIRNQKDSRMLDTVLSLGSSSSSESSNSRSSRRSSDSDSDSECTSDKSSNKTYAPIQKGKSSAFIRTDVESISSVTCRSHDPTEVAKQVSSLEIVHGISHYKSGALYPGEGLPQSPKVTDRNSRIEEKKHQPSLEVLKASFKRALKDIKDEFGEDMANRLFFHLASAVSEPADQSNCEYDSSTDHGSVDCSQSLEEDSIINIGNTTPLTGNSNIPHESKDTSDQMHIQKRNISQTEQTAKASPPSYMKYRTKLHKALRPTSTIPSESLQPSLTIEDTCIETVHSISQSANLVSRDEKAKRNESEHRLHMTSSVAPTKVDALALARSECADSALNQDNHLTTTSSNDHQLLPLDNLDANAETGLNRVSTSMISTTDYLTSCTKSDMEIPRYLRYRSSLLSQVENASLSSRTSSVHNINPTPSTKHVNGGIQTPLPSCDPATDAIPLGRDNTNICEGVVHNSENGGVVLGGDDDEEAMSRYLDYRKSFFKPMTNENAIDSSSGKNRLAFLDLKNVRQSLRAEQEAKTIDTKFYESQCDQNTSLHGKLSTFHDQHVEVVTEGPYFEFGDAEKESQHGSESGEVITVHLNEREDRGTLPSSSQSNSPSSFFESIVSTDEIEKDKFLYIWNTVQSDRTQLESIRDYVLERKHTTESRVTYDGKPQGTSLSTPDGNRQVSNTSHDVCIDIGNDTSGLDSEAAKRAAQYRQSLKFKYSILIFLLVALPVSIGLIVYSLERNGKLNDLDSNKTVYPSHVTLAPSVNPSNNLRSMTPSRRPDPLLGGPPLESLFEVPTLFPKATTAPLTYMTEEELLQLIMDASFDEGIAVQTTNTPQQKAYSWIASNEMLSEYSHQRIIQRYALATLYFSTNGDDWVQQDNWITEENECSWFTSSIYDSTCDDDGFFVNLDLGINQLSGVLPPELALLTNLSRIILSGNANEGIGGTVPSVFGLMTNLKVFDLSGNIIRDRIPDEISQWSNIEVIDLSMNNISGTIPDIGRLTTLRELRLSSNSITGTLPGTLSLLSNLEYLRADDNNIDGELPSSLANLPKLRELNLGKNAINSVPRDVFSIRSLEILILSDNRISTPLFSEIGELHRLTRLELHTNGFDSEIPTEIGNLSNLLVLNLSRNQLRGTIPSEIGNLVYLSNLFLDGNNLSGRIPDEIGNFIELVSIRLDDNDLSGVVPDAVCSAFASYMPKFSLDCGTSNGLRAEVECPYSACCTYCCNDGEGCQCLYKDTALQFLC